MCTEMKRLSKTLKNIWEEFVSIKKKRRALTHLNMILAEENDWIPFNWHMNF